MQVPVHSSTMLNLAMNILHRQITFGIPCTFENISLLRDLTMLKSVRGVDRIFGQGGQQEPRWGQASLIFIE